MRYAAIALAAVALAAGTSGAFASPARSDQVIHGSLASKGIERTYRLFVPGSLGRRPALVLVLHGGFGTGDSAAIQSGFDDRARKAGFLVVYPDGIGRSWNALTCCGLAQQEHVDDVAFLSRLIQVLATRYDVDRHRVYATGISNGGLMAYVLGCRDADAIAAIGPVSATMDFDSCSPSRPVSILHIHGTADENIPFSGGVGTKGVTHRSWRSVPDTISRWRLLDHCSTPVEHRSRLVATSVSQCARGTAVQLDLVIGGGHSWPDGQRMSPLLDPPSNALDATDTLWRFFAEHPQR